MLEKDVIRQKKFGMRKRDELHSTIATKKDAFEAGYLVSSGINRDGGFYAEIHKRPYSEANGAYFVHATSGKTEDEALLEAFEWIESGDKEIENIHKQRGTL